MYESKDLKRLAYVCILGIVAAVIFVMFLLYLIWFPKNKNTTQDSVVKNSENVAIESSADSNLGKYKTITRNTKNQLSEYSIRILNLFLSKDIDGIYAMLNKEYIEYYNLDKNKLKTMLEEKYYLGRQFTVYQYSSVVVNGNNVFLVYIRSNDKMAENTFIITEYSPRNYSISFDNFLFHDKTKKEYIRDGMKYTLSDQVGFTSSYSARINIKNTSDTSITFNKEHNYEVCFLRFDDGNDLRSTETFASGEQFNMKKNTELNAKVNFQIDRLAYPRMKSIVIKGITFDDSGNVKEVEIPVQ